MDPEILEKLNNAKVANALVKERLKSIKQRIIGLRIEENVPVKRRRTSDSLNCNTEDLLANTRIKEIETTNKILESRANILIRENDELKHRNKVSHECISELNNEIVKCKTEIDKLDSEKRVLETNYKVQAEYSKTVTDNVQILNMEIATLKTDKEKLNDSLSLTISTLKAEKEHIEKIYQSERNTVEKLTQIGKIKDTQIIDLKKEINDLVDKISQLKADIEDIKNKLGAKEDILHEQNTEITTLNEIKANHLLEIETLKSKIETIEHQSAKSKREMNDNREKIILENSAQVFQWRNNCIQLNNYINDFQKQLLHAFKTTSNVSEPQALDSTHNYERILIHQNLNGFSNKKDVLQHIIKTIFGTCENKVLEFICFTEMFAADIELPGFTLADSYCRKDKSRGGSCILARDGLKTTKIEYAQSGQTVYLRNFAEEYFECCGIRVPEYNLIIICVYRKSGSQVKRFLDKFNELLTGLLKQNNDQKIIVTGDWNINTLEDSQDSNRLKNIINDYNLKFHITKPTRQKNCIDHIVSNIPQARGFNVELGISDHNMAQFMIFKLKEEENND